MHTQAHKPHALGLEREKRTRCRRCKAKIGRCGTRSKRNSIREVYQRTERATWWLMNESMRVKTWAFLNAEARGWPREKDKTRDGEVEVQKLGAVFRHARQRQIRDFFARR